MQLVLLGTAGYHPSDTRQTACLMLPELGIVLDAGTGFYRARDFLATEQLDIFLTHAHLDHIVGVTYLFDVLAHKQARATVHALENKLTAVREHLLAEAVFPVAPPCEFRALAPTTPLAQEGKLTHFPLAHPGGSIGFRLDWPGHSLAYITDTTARPDADYVEQIRGVDLLVHECNFSDDMREMAELTGHSHTTPVAEVAHEAGVGRLLLVHLNPLAMEPDPVGLVVARKIFPRTELGADLMIVEF